MPDDITNRRIPTRDEVQLKPAASLTEEVLYKILSLLGTSDPNSAFGPPSPLSFELQKPANSFIAKLVNKIINSRNEVYHATIPRRAESIINLGKILPGGLHNLPRENPGVSVSRIPNIPSFESREVRLVLDPNKMPKANPLAEIGGYEKVLGEGSNNPHFEFENRTLNKPISIDAIKKILIGRYDDPAFYRDKGFETEVYPKVKVLNTYRAAKAWADYYKTKMMEQTGLVPDAKQVFGNVRQVGK